MEPPLSSGDIPGVLALLNGAISNVSAQQKQAESVLAALEQRQGFCSCLVVRRHRHRPISILSWSHPGTPCRKSSPPQRHASIAPDGWPQHSSRTASGTGEGGLGKGEEHGAPCANFPYAIELHGVDWGDVRNQFFHLLLPLVGTGAVRAVWGSPSHFSLIVTHSGTVHFTE